MNHPRHIPNSTSAILTAPDTRASWLIFLAFSFQLSAFSFFLRAAEPPPAPDPVEAPLGDRLPLARLDFFSKPGPHAISFRDDHLGNKSVETFNETVLQSLGHMPKMFDEERPQSASNLPRMQDLAKAHPEKLLFNHWNARGMRADSSLNHYFSAAHWLYYPGTTLAASVSVDDSTIDVADGALFKTGHRVPRYEQNRKEHPQVPGERNDPIVIVPVENGRKIWEKAEFAIILSLEKNQLKVQRGIFGTPPAAFDKGAWVAPVLTRSGYLGNETYRLYNYSIDCPRDEKGRNCADAMCTLFYDWFKPGGPLERIHGIEPDVFPWSLGTADTVVIDDNTPGASVLKGRVADTDCDGRPDNGYDKEGLNRFSLGVYDSMRKIRLVLGPERLISGDGNGPGWMRCLSFQNGMESEGLTWHADPDLRLWSTNLNIWPFWQQHCTQPFQFNLAVTKVFFPDGTPDVERLERERRRLAWATASILDIGVTADGIKEPRGATRAYRIFDEYNRGKDDKPNWLGKPASPILRPALNTTDLLDGAGTRLDSAFVNAWKGENTSLRTRDGALEISSASNKSAGQNLTIHYEKFQIPEGDLFFRFLVKMDTLKGLPDDTFRYVTVTVDGRQNLPKVRAKDLDKLYGVADASGYSEACFFFHNAGPATVTLNLSFEGDAPASLKEFTVHCAPDLLAREFENGAVLANPSDNPQTFRLSELFPGASFRRIQGLPGDPSPDANNGQPVGDTVELPPLSGLFLVKQP